ncbi:MAG: copper-binding protein, partial [Asticcacaulis sp. 32-58-5]
MTNVHRRKLLQNLSLFGATAAVSGLLPAWAKSASPGLNAALQTVAGSQIRLTLDRGRWPIEGRSGNAITINGTVPGPIVRLKEGQTVKLIIDNRLDETSSIHWHGLLVPFQMDGVPGVSFPGIPARSTF